MTNVVDFSSARSRVAPGGSPPYDGGMEVRAANLEALAEKTGERLGVIERDAAIIKSNYATREDLQAAKADLHKAMNDQTWKIITWMTGISTALVAATFFLARFVK